MGRQLWSGVDGFAARISFVGSFRAQGSPSRLETVRPELNKLDAEIKSECAKFSEDVKYFAEFQTGIKAFDPWMKKAEQRIIDGLKQPKSLVEACEILGDSKVTLAPPKMCLGRNVIYTSSFPLRTSKKNVRRS